MSVCDTCPVPGNCCRAICLGGGRFAKEAQTLEEAEQYIRDSATGANGTTYPAGNPLPFHPLFKRVTDGAWIWWCPNLNMDTGRCDDYENRPMACSDYQPMEDALCVLYEACTTAETTA